ncbi:hypothetical protein K505DRAFT_293440 [Melanomma pulvis-pyrius CBS 109.77]|uniref:Uncharacterized protein n=1 Tax=Melanomma pulvis-pyrius CBS 109.77 TaxID=1314802 RepID=A0A6A6XV43_9PLEO|nr:hypothetical protein K505DRAFT_293440 [Melanomma pulvis-pyrius CBS 109.77]
MNAAEDDDLKLQRASALALSNLEKLLLRILRKHKHGSTTGEVRSRVRILDMWRAFGLIDPFQEDPQLLDTHLKTLIPPLVSAYLDSLHMTSPAKSKKDFVPLSHAICQILNLFCKVRGEKVIKGFLNNEPKYLEPILHEFEKGTNFKTKDDEPLPQGFQPWTERYVLLLWLSHLMLAPFPLASMSSLQSSQDTAAALGIDLPPSVPGVALRVLTICVNGLQSASKERSAAAHLLVRLCVRPDMQKLGLLDTLVKWSLSFFSNISESLADIHQCLGVLSFLSGLVTSATNVEIGPFLPAIFQSCQNIISQDSLVFVRSSAVARKLVVKTLRNIVVHCLQSGSTPSGLDVTTVLEEVIEFLLESVADGDSLVRYSASKALSIVTMKLEPEMAGDVVEAILGSLNENVYWQGSKRNLSGVNPLQWHGLTLTLSHLLYRRALSTTQLPDIINALLLALAFEQRSATGGSIGTNVRDAACFGIWAMSRRYTTEVLLAVETSSIRASQHYKSLSVPQVLAIELLVVACFDPAGNIRRGSSAALQELVGRNPNTVVEGITLVQIVDFHAVGLRERAMCEVAIKAGGLRQIYWEALFENLLGWRGTGSMDAPSRLSASSAVGFLSLKRPPIIVRSMSDQICAQLRSLKPREVEERHGLVMSLSALVTQSTPSKRQNESPEIGLGTEPEVTHLTHLWTLLENVLKLEDNSFISPTLRPEYTASAICNFIGALATMTCRLTTKTNMPQILISEIVRLLSLCLGRQEEAVLEAIPSTTRGVIELLTMVSPDEKHNLISGWLLKLENEASYNGLRCSGHAIALGAAYSLLDDGPTGETARIVKTLTFRCTSAVAIDARKVALQAIEVLLRTTQSADSTNQLTQDFKESITTVLHIALNDYTVTERGDVGSLVRLEALTTTGTAWSTGLLKGSSSDDDLHADVLRLSLEKLDKVRTRAAEVLEKGENEHFQEVISSVADGISSYEYFSNALKTVQPETPYAIKEAILLGFVSSAGMGSESVVQNSRAALLNAIDLLPTSNSSDNITKEFSLLEFTNCLIGLLKGNLDCDRVLIPLLDVLAFLFDMHVMHRLVPTTFNFRTLLSLTQKAHFKSTHMQKLNFALDVYRGLGSIDTTRADTIVKVTAMLLHPFPNVRISAAETLWVLTQQDELKRHDWSLPSKNLKPAVVGIQSLLSEGTKIQSL